MPVQAPVALHDVVAGTQRRAIGYPVAGAGLAHEVQVAIALGLDHAAVGEAAAPGLVARCFQQFLQDRGFRDDAGVLNARGLAGSRNTGDAS